LKFFCFFVPFFLFPPCFLFQPFKTVWVVSSGFVALFHEMMRKKTSNANADNRANANGD
jgi:hypothetical protein